MNSWAPLFCGLVDSSIWEEEDHVFRVFMALMSLKDHNHVVSMDGFRLAKRIHMPVDRVIDALKVLASPDSKRPGQEFDGRRIELVDGGWLILKGQYYRELVSTELKRARNRRSQKAFRERKKEAVNGTPLAGEAAYERAVNRGEDGKRELEVVTRNFSSDPDNPDAVKVGEVRPDGSTVIAAERPEPIPEIPRGAVLPVAADEQESGQWVDGEWVPDPPATGG